MSGVRAGRCWDGGEDGEDGRWRWGGAEKEAKGGTGKAGERERERVVDIGKRRREQSGAFPRTVGPGCGVGCPALISAHSASGFSSNPVLPKPQREVGG